MPTLRRGIPLPILGLDVAKPGEYIDPRATPDCLNIQIHRTQIQKRLGTTALGTSMLERIMGLGQLQLGSSIYVVRVGIESVQVLNQGTSTWSSIAHSSLTGSAADRICFAFPLLSGAKIMVFTNGIDAIRKYTGSGNDADLGGSPPKAKFCIAFGSYLVLANIVTVEAGSRLASDGNGGPMAATIEKRWGVSGTLYGQPGYDSITSTDLWPWPNEKAIKGQLCEEHDWGFCDPKLSTPGGSFEVSLTSYAVGYTARFTSPYADSTSDFEGVADAGAGGGQITPPSSGNKQILGRVGIKGGFIK